MSKGVKQTQHVNIMFRPLFYSCKNAYFKSLSTIVTLSGTSGLLTGIGVYNYDIDNKKI